ncbi:hypothetical protein RJ640_027088 [Escallonia rubra]|uniref:Reverse transcriptase Ty1/copia-type domain-containing protein n=1 Tax=Escallonia rubra TaxID=112253 RepID=A0AA88R007_9ASTE|nr:hypothetical protein RJ640_027088 [Escallonia rubra]
MASSSSSKYPYPAALNIGNFVSLKLTLSNFLLWKTQFISLAESQEMIGFLDGDYPMPSKYITASGAEVAGDKPMENPDFKAWKRSDRLLRGWITGTLSEEVLGLVVGLETSSEVWAALVDSFAQESQEREFYLTQKLQFHSRKDFKTMSEYLRVFKEICDDLAAIGQPVDDRQKVFGLLKGLGIGYESFITTMLKPPIPSYKEIVQLLQGHETMRALHSAEVLGANPHAAFVGQHTHGQHGGKNNKRGKQGYDSFTSKGRGFAQASYSPSHENAKRGSQVSKSLKNSSQEKEEVKCQICDKPRHTALRCYQRFNQAYQPEDTIKALAAMSMSDSQDLAWFPDTGATQHMTDDIGNLQTYTPYFGSEKIMVGSMEKSLETSLDNEEFHQNSTTGDDCADLTSPSKFSGTDQGNTSLDSQGNSINAPSSACEILSTDHDHEINETHMESNQESHSGQTSHEEPGGVLGSDTSGFDNEHTSDSDIAATSDNSNILAQIIAQLQQEFAMKDLGYLHYFLGIEVRKFSQGLFLSQKKYATELLDRAQMKNCKPIGTPMIARASSATQTSVPFSDPHFYRSIVEGLQYLTFTRPDISYSVNYVCQYMQNPTNHHFQLVKRILRYVHGTLGHGIRLLSQGSLDLYGFSDADWAGCPNTRRSTTGFCTFLGSNCISWSAKKQATVARSSTEAEYRALASTAAEITWLSFILRDIGVHLSRPPALFCDNISALHLTINPVFHARTKHIEIDYHFVREKVALGSLTTRFVSSENQVADILTKPLTRSSFEALRVKLGLWPPPQSSLRGSVKGKDKVSPRISENQSQDLEEDCRQTLHEISRMKSAS